MASVFLPSWMRTPQSVLPAALPSQRKPLPQFEQWHHLSWRGRSLMSTRNACPQSPPGPPRPSRSPCSSIHSHKASTSSRWHWASGTAGNLFPLVNIRQKSSSSSLLPSSSAVNLWPRSSSTALRSRKQSQPPTTSSTSALRRQSPTMTTLRRINHKTSQHRWPSIRSNSPTLQDLEPK